MRWLISQTGSTTEAKMPDGYLTIEEFAKLYNCSVRYAQQLVREKKSPDYYKVGRTVRFTREAVDRWLAKHFVKCEET